MHTKVFYKWQNYLHFLTLHVLQEQHVIKSTTNCDEIFLYDTNVPPFTAEKYVERIHPKNI